MLQEYQRIGRIEPVLKPLALDGLIDEVLSGQTLAAPAGVRVERKLEVPATQLQADRDLISAAVENLVRNAFEALPEGGVVTVRTVRAPDDANRALLSVSDTGKG